MITLQGFGPAWSLPCLSPFVTKAAYYMRLAGVDYTFAPVNPFELKSATPFGKLPVINDDGTIVADSTAIIDYLERKRGEPLNKGASARERAVMLAFNRLLDEHFYWCAVVLPRWRDQKNWERYIPILCGGHQPDKALREALEMVRGGMQAELEGHGVGRLDDFDRLCARSGRRRRAGGSAWRSALFHGRSVAGHRCWRSGFLPAGARFPDSEPRAGSHGGETEHRRLCSAAFASRRPRGLSLGCKVSLVRGGEPYRLNASRRSGAAFRTRMTLGLGRGPSFAQET